MKISAVIPALNEEETIQGVVAPLVASGLFEEVIVVSDGSKDRTAELAALAGARVVSQETNFGKGASMIRGVEESSSPYVAFFDADLFNLTEDHARNLVEPVLKGDVMMNVGVRDRGPLLSFFSRHLPAVSGERAMAREIFEAIPQKHLQGYMAETAMNHAVLARGGTIGRMHLSGVTLRRKDQKVGFLKGMVQYIGMWMQVAYAMVIVRLS